MQNEKSTQDRTAASSYEQIVAVNEHKLDRDCVRLSTDLLRFSRQVADKRQERDEVKRDMIVLEAELGKKIRQNPAVYGLEKVTEGAIKEVVLCNKNYRAKQQEMADAEHELEIAQAVVDALQMKKRTLTLLVDLHGMGYFADVKVSGEGREAIRAQAAKRMARRANED